MEVTMGSVAVLFGAGKDALIIEKLNVAALSHIWYRMICSSYCLPVYKYLCPQADTLLS